MVLVLNVDSCKVAPFAGAWIEISSHSLAKLFVSVAPFAGAWIEILFDIVNPVEYTMSLPSRERGLKSSCVVFPDMEKCRSLRGSVD